MIAKMAYRLFNSVWFATTSRVPLGHHVYESDWDILILLDTCRPDALSEVKKEYSFLSRNHIDTKWSIASNSRGWIAGTFREKYREEVENTVYINANGYASEILEHRRRFPSEDGIRDLSAWDTLTGEDMLLHHPVRDYLPAFELDEFVPPSLVVDRAVSAWRAYDADRFIVHFHQPHSPFCYHPWNERREFKEWEWDPFTALKEGEVSREMVWSAYLDELRFALNSVALLINSVDTDSIILSADHGEAFGEFGFYRHMLGVPHPQMKKVPWVCIKGSGYNSDYEPEFPLEEAEKYASKRSEEEIKDRLRNLGYYE